MGGSLATFLNFYVFPMVGLCLLALGAWSTWELWARGGAARSAGPSLAARVAALILGWVGGWWLANLPHALDSRRVILGFPMPVMTLTKASGRWLELGSTASIPCLLLDLAIGIGMVNAALRLVWKFRPRPRPRRRTGFIDSWRAHRPGAVVRTGRERFAHPLRRSQRSPLIGTRVPVQGRAGHRELAEFGLEEPEALPAGPDSSRS